MDIPFIDVHTHQSNKIAGSNVIAVVNKFAHDLEIPALSENSFYSVGLHPWHINTKTMYEDLQRIRQVVNHKTIIAVGETGLDRSTQTPMLQQKEVFGLHLAIAQSAAKPVVVHAVKTYPDIVEVYKKTGVNVKMIFHGFAGSPQISQQLINRKFYLSFGEQLFDDEKKTAGIFKTIPCENIFLETDESVKSIHEIYEKAAEIKNLKLNELKKIIYQNIENCFGKLI